MKCDLCSFRVYNESRSFVISTFPIGFHRIRLKPNFEWFSQLVLTCKLFKRFTLDAITPYMWEWLVQRGGFERWGGGGGQTMARGYICWKWFPVSFPRPSCSLWLFYVHYIRFHQLPGVSTLADIIECYSSFGTLDSGFKAWRVL